MVCIVDCFLCCVFLFHLHPVTTIPFVYQFPSWTWMFLWSNVKCVCCERSENTWWEIVWHYVSWPCVVLNYWQALPNFWWGKLFFTNGVCPHLLWCFIMFKMTASWIECSSIVRQSIQDLSYPLFTVTLSDMLGI